MAGLDPAIQAETHGRLATTPSVTTWMAGSSPAMTRRGRRRRRLANKFILVSNLVASDGGKAIAAGNGRVVRARLADARHFWRTDLAPLHDYADKADKPLDQRLEKLKALNIVFHEKLGTQGERVARIAALAKRTGADRRRRRRPRRARGAARQGRSGHRDGRRVPRAAGPDGPLLRERARRRAERRRRDRGALQAARPERPHPDFADLGRRRARRQARHARRLLGDRREADGQQGPVCAAKGGAGGDQDRAGERAAAIHAWAILRSICMRGSHEVACVESASQKSDTVGIRRDISGDKAALDDCRRETSIRPSSMAAMSTLQSTSSPSSPTASKSICATRARGTI